MLRCSFLQRVARKQVFELFCREKLLGNYSLRALDKRERRTALTGMFRELPKESLHELERRAAVEEARIEALHRAAATFKPLTPYDFFVKEQRNNPALGSVANPREREVKLLQIYETLPDKAKEALAERAERYNEEHSKVPVTASVDNLSVFRKKVVAKKVAKSKKASKKKKKRKTKKRSAGKGAKAGKKKNKLVSATDETSGVASKAPASSKRKGVVTPYSLFVKEQMLSLSDVPPKERMRIIGERWRGLSESEREARLSAAKARIAEDTAAKPVSTPVVAEEPSPSSASAPTSTADAGRDASPPAAKPAQDSSETADFSAPEAAATPATASMDRPTTNPPAAAA